MGAWGWEEHGDGRVETGAWRSERGDGSCGDGRRGDGSRDDGSHGDESHGDGSRGNSTIVCVQECGGMVMGAIFLLSISKKKLCR